VLNMHARDERTHPAARCSTIEPLYPCLRVCNVAELDVMLLRHRSLRLPTFQLRGDESPRVRARIRAYVQRTLEATRRARHRTLETGFIILDIFSSFRFQQKSLIDIVSDLSLSTLYNVEFPFKELGGRKILLLVKDPEISWWRESPYLLPHGSKDLQPS